MTHTAENRSKVYRYYLFDSDNLLRFWSERVGRFVSNSLHRNDPSHSVESAVAFLVCPP